MPSYSIFGFTLESDVPFPGWPVGNGPADATLRRQTVTLEDVRAEDGGDYVGERLYFEPLDSDIYFTVRDGKEIAFDPQIPVADDVLRQWTTGIFLPVLLRQRGMLVVHACSVVRDGIAVCFVGNSGWGKSTLAHHFSMNGWKLLADDVTAIMLDDHGTVRIPPGYPNVRIRPESGGLVQGFEELPRVNASTDKRIMTVSNFASEGGELAALYILDPTGDGVAVMDLAPAEATMHLIAHTRSKDLLTHPEYGKQMFTQITRLTRSLPVQKLVRPDSLAALAEMQRVVERAIPSTVQPS